MTIYYQTPAMQKAGSVEFEKGELVTEGLPFPGTVAIKRQDGAYVSVLGKTPYVESAQKAGVFDQESFVPDPDNRNLLLADRTAQGGKTYVILLRNKP